MDRDIALEALRVLCNADVTSVQRQSLQAQAREGAATRLLIKNFIPTVLDADETSQVSRSNLSRIRTVLESSHLSGDFTQWQNTARDTKTGQYFIIDEDEFFDPRFDYDFTNLRDTETYYRGGEVYERPCGWQRFALKVLDKYDGNTWLGTQYRSTQSVPGEWPVSYHGTSQKGAEGIIEGFYQPGPGQAYGRGIYSTPYIEEALPYAKTFTSIKNGKTYKVILQNRINPNYRQKHNNDRYWLVPVPAGLSSQQEQEMVERAIRPYGLLLKEI